MDARNWFKNRKVQVLSLIAVIAAVTCVLLVKNVLDLDTGKYVSVDKAQKVESTDPDFSPGEMAIVPLIYDAAGVDIESAFKIICGRPVKKEGLERYLSVSPQEAYEIVPTDGSGTSAEFLLTFRDGLEKNSVYRLGIQNEKGEITNSWAFQTVKELKVLRTLPRNQSTNVPVNTGIEITFSHDNVEELEKYFEISPAVKGRFEYHKRVVVFVPEGLEKDTIYTVTIKKGLHIKGSALKLEDDVSFQFQTQMDEDTSLKQYISFEKQLNNFSTDTVPYVRLYADEQLMDKELSVEIYQYQNLTEMAEFLEKEDSIPRWARTKKEESAVDTSRLQKVSEFKTKIFQDFGYTYSPQFIVLPSKLPQGGYLLVASVEDQQVYTHLQISDTAAYVMVSENGTIIWVNDIKDHKPVQGAAVELEGYEQVKTDENGVAMIPGNIRRSVQDRNFYFKIFREGKPLMLADVPTWSYFYYDVDTEGDQSAYYWNYIYTDRGMYLPDDTIRFWGLVKPRSEDTPAPKVTVHLTKSGYSDIFGQHSNVLDEAEPTVSDLGTFAGEFRLSNLSPGYYVVEVRADGKYLTGTSIEVQRYTKPAYKIDIETDKKIIKLGESFTADIQASFFEGSPVVGVKLSYYMGNSGNGELQCDEEGRARLVLGEQIDETYFRGSWRPQQFYLSVYNKLAEEEEVRQSVGITVFPSDLMVKAKAGSDGSTGTVNIETNNVDLTKILSAQYVQQDEAEMYYAYYPEESYKGSPANVSLHADVYLTWYEAKEIGDYYDFINKEVRKKYEYVSKTELLKSIDFITSDGKYTLEFPVEKKGQYRIEISGRDSKGYGIKETIYMSGYDYYSVTAQKQKIHTLSLAGGKDSFRLGEKVEVEVLENSEKIEGRANDRTLFLQMKNGILNYEVKDESRTSFSFSKEHIPNFYMKAIYFDGTYLYSTGAYGGGQSMLRYDYSEKELVIDIKTDKEKYRPGDKVIIEAEVKDQSGKPVAAEVNLSVVDEAFFAIKPQRVETLKSLYSYSFISGEITEYWSHTPITPINPMAEKGGGGSMTRVRTDFKDTALFTSIRTGEDGKGSTGFTLPDNLTSWRITYQAVSESMDAGSGKINVDATLPFFVNLVYNSVFMESDQPSLLLRSYGTEVSGGEDVEYNVTLEGENGFKKTYSINGKTHQYVQLPLDALKKGKYALTAEARCGNYSDAVRREFEVVDSMLKATRLEYYTLEKGLKISRTQDASGLMSLTFYNSQAFDYFRALCSLSYSWGQRADQKLAREIAGDILKKYYGDEVFLYDEQTDFQEYQLDDGGIALLTYDSSSPEVSAKAASLAPDLFDRGALTSYFYSIVDAVNYAGGTISNQNASGGSKQNYSGEDIAYAYWGLAALREPVLIDILNYLNVDPQGGSSTQNRTAQLSDREKLIFSIALAELGDFTNAKGVFEQTVAGRLNSVKPYVYYNGKTREDILSMTALCSVAAVKLNLPEAEGLFRYIEDNTSSLVPVYFEKLNYVMHAEPDASGKGSFTYELDGNSFDVELEGYRHFTMVLTSDKLKTLEFTRVAGDITVEAGFTGPVTEMLEGSHGQHLVKLTRTYTVNGSQTDTFSQSDFITVTIIPEFDEAAPDGYYEIVDVLPAGLKYITPRPNSSDRVTYGKADGQRVLFWFYYSKNAATYSGIKPIVYNARVVLPGEYQADGAFIKHYASDVWGASEKTVIEVNE